MSEVKRCMAVSASRTFGDGNLVVAASDYDALAAEIERLRLERDRLGDQNVKLWARLAEAERLLRQTITYPGTGMATPNPLHDWCKARDALLADQPSAAPCKVVEYDGAFKCITHNKLWGAVPNPDVPCTPDKGTVEHK